MVHRSNGKEIKKTAYGEMLISKVIGFKKYLEIAEKEQWTIDDIQKRTDKLVAELLQVYKFPE